MNPFEHQGKPICIVSSSSGAPISATGQMAGLADFRLLLALTLVLCGIIIALAPHSRSGQAFAQNADAKQAVSTQETQPNADAAMQKPKKPNGVRALVIMQNTTNTSQVGGKDSAKHSQEVLIVSAKALRFVNGSGDFFLLDSHSEDGKCYHVSGDEKEYIEVPKGEMQQRRSLHESQIIDKLKGAPSAERDRQMKDLHLLPGHKRVIRTEKTAAEAIELGGLSYAVSRYKVYENDRLIVNALVTDSVDFEAPFFRFYSQLGAFSDEVLAELKKISGLPLSVDFTVVSVGPIQKIESRITRLFIKEDLPKTAFELPPTAKLRLAEEEVVNCGREGCENEVEVDAPGAQTVVNGRNIYFCCPKCRKQFVDDRYNPK